MTDRPTRLNRSNAVWSELTAKDLLALFAVWVVLLACMALAHALNYRIGLNVWPMGEDRVWIEILQDKSRSEAAKAWWQINDRNALQPWWYIALRPVIFRLDSGIFLIREVIGLILGLTAYIFLFVMTRARPFALGVACVVAVFLANGYIDQIYWVMQLALVFSLWSVTFYKLSIERVPTDYRLYACAIVAWFFALGTYSVQTGALLAVAFLAFTAPASDIFARLRRALIDTLPFALIFVVFWLEWQTAARTNYAKPLRLREALLSLIEAFWHFDYLLFFTTVAYAALDYKLLYLVVATAVAASVFLALRRCDAENSATMPSWHLLLKTAVAIACLAVPVVAVESIGHGIVGEAWRKVYQFTTPFLYLSIVAALLAVLPVEAARWSWRVATASLAALATAVTLGINRIQIDVTHNEKLLRDGLARLAQQNFNEGHAPPYYFLVRREPDFLWYSSDILSPTYARTWQFPLATSFRFLPGADGVYSPFLLRFSDDGVENAALDGTKISNPHIFPISVSRAGVRRLCLIGPNDVASPRVEWQRSTALVSNVGECASKSGNSS